MANFADARHKMVDNQLRAGGVSDHRLLIAMGEVRRERFVPTERRALAYADVMHALGGDRYLGAPTPFALLVQLAEIVPGDRVLDVGAGTGYGTAVLARLAIAVTGLEADATLAGQANANLVAEGVGNAKIVVGGFDGGGLSHLRYDVIVIEGALEADPAHLFGHLSDGGRLVALVQSRGPAVAMVYVKAGDEVTARSEFNATLPLLTRTAPSEAFSF